MPVGVRKHLQQARLKGWERIPFPKWPVDTTVDQLMRQTLRLVLKAGGTDRLPFIWFWPDGAPSCTMLTHDVEGKAGLDFCGALMDLDDRFGMKSAFQLIPESTDGAWEYAAEIRRRGLRGQPARPESRRALVSRQAAVPRARPPHQRVRASVMAADGFRSGAMYREQGWYDASSSPTTCRCPTARTSSRSGAAAAR